MILVVLTTVSCAIDERSAESSPPARITRDQPIDTLADRGTALYEMHCARCHHLLRTSTASPLGGISEFRDSAYLYRSVKNFMELVEEGNSIAMCMYEKYARSPMPAFPDLSDHDVGSILYYIDWISMNSGDVVFSNAEAKACVE